MTKPRDKGDLPTAMPTLDPGINRLSLSTGSPPLPHQIADKDGASHKIRRNPQNTKTNDGGDASYQTPRHRFLSRAEWVVLAHGVGAVSDTEQHQLVHPTHWWWPPKGMVGGLYKSVVRERAKSFYLFHAASSCRWALMIIQLLIGAALTALGSHHQSFQDGTPVTVLGAVNTIIAGLLALLHNSGLPDRYRYNKTEFEGLEDHIRELLDTGLVPVDKTIDQVLAECFDIFQEAKATVQANMPVTYKPGQGLKDARRSSLISPQSSKPHRSGAEQGSRLGLETEKMEPATQEPGNK